MAAKKITVKDLASEVEKLSEMNQKKDDLIKALDEKIIILQNWAQENFSSICKKITENDQLHFENEKILDQKVSDFNLKLVESKNEQAEEKKEERIKTVNVIFRCKECSLGFGNKATLKKHIVDNHPKKVECNLCDEIFDQIWKLEQHLETLSAEKSFTCTICDKKCLLQWRLKKHITGHTDQNVFQQQN
jgi:regulator of replication initiation timing